MSKYNQKPTKPAGVQGFIANEYNAPTRLPRNYVSEQVPVYEPTPTTRTHEGAPAWNRDKRSELFLLSVTGFLGNEDTFYESGEARDDRFRRLVHETTLLDPVWTAQFLMWLRNVANMRTASLIGACQFSAAVAKFPELNAKLATVELSARKVVSSVLRRADEPGEILAYWHSHFSRQENKPLKRGIADAVLRLYNERNWLKWDSVTAAWRFADVLDRVHPDTGLTWQGDLFKHILDVRHGRGDGFVPASLTMLTKNMELRSQVARGDARALLIPGNVADAGLTWEDVLSLGGEAKLDKARLWGSVIPTMPYMATLRNLRNFDQAGISDFAVNEVKARLIDPVLVSSSRQLPYRFYSAYKAVSSDRWREPLGRALALSMRNIPKLSGRNLVLIDLSGSMKDRMSTGRRRMVAGRMIMDISGRAVRDTGSTLTRAEAAALFGVTLGLSIGADVRIFGTTSAPHEMLASASPLREVERMMRRIGECGLGTNIAQAVRQGYRAHDRVFIISDMQSMDASISNQIPGSVPMYGFDLAGYQANPMALGPNRVQLGGLTDATFKMIPLIEAGATAKWPWE